MADMEPEELEEWRTIFNLFDVDGDESITSEVSLEKWCQQNPGQRIPPGGRTQEDLLNGKHFTWPGFKLPKLIVQKKHVNPNKI
jgi:hypothetical protein